MWFKASKGSLNKSLAAESMISVSPFYTLCNRMPYKPASDLDYHISERRAGIMWVSTLFGMISVRKARMSSKS